jgi:hypothetical protein
MRFKRVIDFRHLFEIHGFRLDYVYKVNEFSETSTQAGQLSVLFVWNAFSFATTERGAHENAHGNMLVVAQASVLLCRAANIHG